MQNTERPHMAGAQNVIGHERDSKAEQPGHKRSSCQVKKFGLIGVARENHWRFLTREVFNLIIKGGF